MSTNDAHSDKAEPDDNGLGKDDGLGKEGTIPDSEDGVAVGHTDESSFEPEEDEQATE
jgi:hypothetical protein